MTLRELEEIGRGLQLEFSKNHNRATRARRILDAYAQLDLATSPPVSPFGDSLPDQTEPKPEFERLIDGQPVDEGTDSQAPQRGGARPGAGRPMGQTEAKARMEHLSDRPHPFFVAFFSELFEAWARGARCPQIALSKEEAMELALPWTQLCEYMGIAQRIPPWLALGVMTLWTTASIFRAKAALAREAAEQRRAQVTASAVNPSTN